MAEHDDQQRIEEAVQFDQFVTELVSVRPENADEAIQKAMGVLLDPLDLDFCAVYRLSEDGRDLRLTHQRTRSGVPEPPLAVYAAHIEYPWIMSRILAGKTTYIRSLDEVPDDAERERFRQL